MATTTTTTVASPVDFETYGDYAPPAGAYRAARQPRHA